MCSIRDKYSSWCKETSAMIEPTYKKDFGKLKFVVYPFIRQFVYNRFTHTKYFMRKSSFSSPGQIVIMASVVETCSK